MPLQPLLSFSALPLFMISFTASSPEQKQTAPKMGAVPSEIEV